MDVCALGSFFMVPPLTQGMMVRLARVELALPRSLDSTSALLLSAELEPDTWTLAQVLFIYFYAMSTGLKVRNATRRFMQKEEEEQGASREDARVKLLEGGDWKNPGLDLQVDVGAGRRLLQKAKDAGVDRKDWIEAKKTLDRAEEAQKKALDPEAALPKKTPAAAAAEAPALDEEEIRKLKEEKKGAFLAGMLEAEQPARTQHCLSHHRAHHRSTVPACLGRCRSVSSGSRSPTWARSGVSSSACFRSRSGWGCSCSRWRICCTAWWPISCTRGHRGFSTGLRARAAGAAGWTSVVGCAFRSDGSAT